jgi:hypothetical protein
MERASLCQEKIEDEEVRHASWQELRSRTAFSFLEEFF